MYRNNQKKSNRNFVRSALIAFTTLAIPLCILSAMPPSLRALPSPKTQTDNSSKSECLKGGPSIKLPSTKLYIEHNSTDKDTGIHGLFDSTDWELLCVFDPSGRQILEVGPKGQLQKQPMSGFFFESAEPPNKKVPISEFLSRFPEGKYKVGGRTADGKQLTGAATFTHAIPAGPVIVSPRKGSIVSASGFAVKWNPVSKTINGKPIKRTGYEVIVTKDVPDDPNGFSRPQFDVHVPPSETSLTVPSEFLEPGTRYELEVLVLEESGNQTLSSLFFKTK